MTQKNFGAVGFKHHVLMDNLKLPVCSNIELLTQVCIAQSLFTQTLGISDQHVV